MKVQSREWRQDLDWSPPGDHRLDFASPGIPGEVTSYPTRELRRFQAFEPRQRQTDRTTPTSSSTHTLSPICASRSTWNCGLLDDSPAWAPSESRKIFRGYVKGLRAGPSVTTSPTSQFARSPVRDSSHFRVLSPLWPKLKGRTPPGFLAATRGLAPEMARSSTYGAVDISLI